MFIYLLECYGGKFGQNCSSICGHCLGKKQCNFINGTCFNGCDEGYHGSYCTKGMNKYHGYCIEKKTVFKYKQN